MQLVQTESMLSSQQNFEALLSQNYDYTRLQRGKVYDAIVLSIREREVMVDLGHKRDAIVPESDLDLLDGEYREELEPGAHVPVYVLKVADKQGYPVVSLKRGLDHNEWIRAQELFDSKEVFEAEVVDTNRGGVLVSFDKLLGFVPNSHLGLSGGNWRDQKSQLVGQVISLVVIEVDQRKNRLILSRRLAREKTQAEVLDTLHPGDTRVGIVRNLTDYGAFVDLGGIDGLIHISEIDWRYIKHPGEVLEEGQDIEVYILSIDYEKKHIALSRKRLLPSLWDRVTDDLNLGQLIEGTVTNVVDYGAFVDIGEGVEGLLHSSEIASRYSLQNLHAGSQVMVRVLKINPLLHRIALRLEYILRE
ncbi:MAG: S1 RNA-binding domain-containing protein [Anaerolineae bacterium]|nr:S1 RNA-binding domain-containing protein [Anaerolineae bacterium]